MYLLDGRPTATVVSGGSTTRLAAPDPVPAGECVVELAFRPPTLSLAVDGTEMASARHGGIMMFPAVGTAGGGLLVGRDRGLAVSDDYQPPFPISGLRRVTISSRAARSSPGRTGSSTPPSAWTERRRQGLR